MKNLLVVLTTIALTFSACSQNEEKKPAAASQEKPALPVKTYETKKQKSTVSKSYSAIIKPYEEVEITARVSGILEKMSFKEGDLVKKGQALYTIEQDIYKANLAQAKANFNKASKDYTRAKSLKESKAISIQSYDDYVFAYEDAKAKLDQAQIQFNYTNITSPIDGIAGKKEFDVGDYVGSNESNSKLITITAIDPVHVEFELTKEDIEQFLTQIRQNKATISLVSKGKTYANGVIDYIAPKLNSQTDTLLLRAKFDNKNQELLIGEFTKIEISNLVLPDSFIVPENAVLKTAKANIVYVIDENNVAQVRPVVTGDLVKDGMVIKDGLKTNEQIVISNLAKLRPKTKVQIVNKEK
jgi:membrane fusion protein (multidrug efflux system)